MNKRTGNYFLLDDSDIGNELISEAIPLAQQSSEKEDILSSSLLIEMKNLNKKKMTRSPPFFKKKQLLDIEIGTPRHDTGCPDCELEQRQKAALKSWQSTLNIDQLLIQIYNYYKEKGFRVILFQRICSIFTIGFIVLFFLFLLNCIDYKSLLNSESGSRHRKLINFIYLDHIFHFSFFWGICCLIFLSYWFWQILKLIFEYQDLVKIRNIYTHVLGIPDQDLATLSIQDIIDKVIEANDKFPLEPDTKLDAHIIANRILRKENYFLSLLNKNILDLRPPLPFIFGSNPLLTKTMEINLSICILQFVFDSNGHIRKKFVENVQINELSLELRKRFVLMAFVNLLASPFILAFLAIYFIFRYGEELYRNPKMLGTRQYTPFALWQFRELNELQAFFDERINLSIAVARTYTSLYPNHLVSIIAKFFGFVAGSFAFVLILWGLLVEDLLLDLEISTGRTMLWYIGVLGVFVAFCRSLIPDETIVYKPEKLLKEVLGHLRFFPAHWKDALHTKMVRNEFSALFNYKIAIFLHEMLSVILTPIILCFSLPKCSIAIINFFKDFSVHVDGLGYVCSFGLFDFYKNGNPKYGVQIEALKSPNENVYFQSERGKMEMSFLDFKEKFPNWKPNPSANLYLDNLHEFGMKLHDKSVKNPKLPRERLVNSHRSKIRYEGPPFSNQLETSTIDDYETECKLRITSSEEEDNSILISPYSEKEKLKNHRKSMSGSSTLLELMNKYVDYNQEID